MNKITNRQVICDTLMEAAKTDRDIMVLCSDSRGSASLTPFAKAYPEQFIEVGIPAAAVSVMMLVVRIFDAFNDPVIGSLADRPKGQAGDAVKINALPLKIRQKRLPAVRIVPGQQLLGKAAVHDLPGQLDPLLVGAGGDVNAQIQVQLSCL